MMGDIMKYLWKRNKVIRPLEPSINSTIEKQNYCNKEDKNTEEYEVVERVIYPEKIICPDCGGITLEGLDFCDRCGGELHDMGE